MRDNVFDMKRFVYIILLAAFLSVWIAGAGAYVSENWRSESVMSGRDFQQIDAELGSQKTLVPGVENKWIICRNDPINRIDPNGEDSYLVMVGDPGIQGTEVNHNVGRNFERLAETRISELVDAGHTVRMSRVSGVPDMNRAMSTGAKIDGAAIYYGHAWTGVLYPGEQPGPGTNVDSSNIHQLSGTNLVGDAIVELHGCNTASGGANSIAQMLANQLGVPVLGWTAPIMFSGDPNVVNSEPNARPPETGPLYPVSTGEQVVVQPDQSKEKTD